MPGATDTYALPFPELDEEPNGPSQVQALAEAVDDALASVAANAVPVSAMLEFAGVTPPAGWLLCDGSAVSRTTYAALYAALGGAASPWGQGNGTTTFNLPDFRGRVTVTRGTHASVDAIGDGDAIALASRAFPPPTSASGSASVSGTTGTPSATNNATFDNPSGTTTHAHPTHTHTVSSTGTATTTGTAAVPYAVALKIVRT